MRNMEIKGALVGCLKVMNHSARQSARGLANMAWRGDLGSWRVIDAYEHWLTPNRAQNSLFTPSLTDARI